MQEKTLDWIPCFFYERNRICIGTHPPLESQNTDKFNKPWLGDELHVWNETDVKCREELRTLVNKFQYIAMEVYVYMQIQSKATNKSDNLSELSYVCIWKYNCMLSGKMRFMYHNH